MLEKHPVESDVNILTQSFHLNQPKLIFLVFYCLDQEKPIKPEFEICIYEIVVVYLE